MNRRTALAALCAVALLPWLPVAPSAAATADQSIELLRARLDPSPDGEWFELSADFAVMLPPQLDEAVNRGLPLHFLVEFELTRPRWYWWDQKTATAALNYRLAYHALTRQYRLTTEGAQQRFSSLGEALKAMAQVREWQVARRDSLQPRETYSAAVRMRLDTSQLPKPFQINALTNRNWNPQSEWKRFAFTPATATSAR